MATIARSASIVCIEEIYFCEAPDVRGRLALMRFEEKEGKIDELAEGLSQ